MSNAIVDAAIAAGFATLERVTTTPTAPFGYGRDISCDSDIHPETDVDPFSPLAIAQALLRRHDTPRGRLPDDPAYGLDLRGELNRGTDPRTFESLSRRSSAECRKDDRVVAARVDVSSDTPNGSALRVKFTITPADPRTGGPFRFTLAVTSAATILSELAKA
jgi:hypothetical protein